AGCGSWMSVAGRRCGPAFSPPAYWAEVEPAATRDELRQTFGRWGLPEEFRLDNGIPWGSAGDPPTDLARWLVRLGIAPVVDPPAGRAGKDGRVRAREGDGQGRGGARDVCPRRGVAAAPRPDGPHPARGIPQPGGPEPLGGLPGAGPLGPALQPGVGGAGLGP